MSIELGPVASLTEDSLGRVRLIFSKFPREHSFQHMFVIDISVIIIKDLIFKSSVNYSHLSTTLSQVYSLQPASLEEVCPSPFRELDSRVSRDTLYLEKKILHY